MAKNRVLEVRIRGAVKEAPSRYAWARGEQSSLYDLERALYRARDDRRIEAVSLELYDVHIGWSKAESLHRAIRAVTASGKPTVAFLTGADNATYLVAAACERVVAAPAGVLTLQSLSAESLFFKDLLGELGVRPQLDAVGVFKSAGESLERRESSEAHRVEMRSILEDTSRRFCELVATARNQTIETVAEAIASGPFIPDDAKDAGLVDDIAHADSVRAWLEERLGAPPRGISYARYIAPPGLLRRAARWRRPQVAGVHACGVITPGEGGRSAEGSLGARPFIETLTKLRERSKVRAVVVRVESPGGGAVASDAIHRELTLLAKEKPVVISMGDVAASGGYYIATAASAVVAEAASMTGSIGVVGGKLVVNRLLDRLGIARETLSLGDNAGMFSLLRPFTEAERAWHRKYLDHFYRARFLPVVADGRSMTIDEADEVGRGRVWTGRQGLANGLVDRLGGLHDAIDIAHEQANLERSRARVVVYGRRVRLRELLSAGLMGGTLASELAVRVALLEELAAEELLLLSPRVFRIR